MGKAKHNRLQPGCSRIVLLIWIGRRCKDAIDRGGWQERSEKPRIFVLHGRLGVTLSRKRFEIGGHRLDVHHPRLDDTHILFYPSQPYLGTELQIADACNESLCECEHFKLSNRVSRVTPYAIKQNQRLMEGK